MLKAAVVLFALVITSLGLYYSFEASLNRQKQNFETDALAVSAAYRSAMDVVDGIATSLSALQMGEQETQSAFARKLIGNYPFVQGFGRFNSVAGDGVAEFSKEQSVRHPEKGPAVWWYDENANRVTAGLASGYRPAELANRTFYPVTSAYTPAATRNNEGQVEVSIEGFDLGSVQALATAVRRAAERGQTEVVAAPSPWPNPGSVFAISSLYSSGDVPDSIEDRRAMMTGGYWLEIDFSKLELPQEIVDTIGLSFSLIGAETEFSMNDSAVLHSTELPDSELLFSAWLKPNEWINSFRAGERIYTIRLSQPRGMTLVAFTLWLLAVAALLAAMTTIAVLNAKRLKALNNQKKQSEKLYLEQQRAAVTLSHIGDAVVSTDVQGNVLYVNKAAAEMLEITAENIIGQPIQSIFRTAPIESQPVRKIHSINRQYYLSDEVVSCDRYLLRVDGSEIAVNETASPVFDVQGSRTGSVVVLRDVTAEKELTRQLEHQINHDPLTGLANRLNFDSQMRALFEQSAEDSGEHALCLIDLDRFKQVNDTCGHAAGDQLLIELSTALGARIRSEDLLARLGGDEFAVVLENCNNEAAISVAHRLHRFFNTYHFEYDGKVFPVRGSIGLVHFVPGEMDFESVSAAADVACYKAKNNGRNAVHVHSWEDEIDSDIKIEELWKPRIDHALNNDGFTLHVQPICALENGEPASPRLHEIFVRMRDEHNTSALYYPQQFLKSAQRYGVTGQIDEWVIANSLESIAALPGYLSNDVFSINLSSESLVRGDFYEYLAAQLLKYSVAGSRLCFELTEESILNNFEESKAAVNGMKKLGCKVALDDFGAGVSSLSSLRDLPLDYLKIDGQFISRMHNSRVDACMVRSIHSFARAMGLKTIAEKVESKQTCQQLAEIGVTYVQGYVVAEPATFYDYFSYAKAA